MTYHLRAKTTFANVTSAPLCGRLFHKDDLVRDTIHDCEVSSASTSPPTAQVDYNVAVESVVVVKSEEGRSPFENCGPRDLTIS